MMISAAAFPPSHQIPVIEFPPKKVPLIARLVKASGLAGDGGIAGDDEGGVKTEEDIQGPAGLGASSWLAPLLLALLKCPAPMAASAVTAAGEILLPVVGSSSGLSKAAAVAINQIESQAAILEGGVSAWSAEAEIVSRSL